jgi:prophage antirepressor-like protein
MRYLIDGIEIPGVKINGQWYFPIQGVCALAGISTPVNAARWARQHVPKEWLVTPHTWPMGGRRPLCLSEAGMRFVLCQGNTVAASEMRNKVFGELR